VDQLEGEGLMLGFTNPMWAYLIGPFICWTAGYLMRGAIDRIAPLDTEVER